MLLGQALDRPSKDVAHVQNRNLQHESFEIENSSEASHMYPPSFKPIGFKSYGTSSLNLEVVPETQCDDIGKVISKGPSDR